MYLLSRLDKVKKLKLSLLQKMQTWSTWAVVYNDVHFAMLQVIVFFHYMVIADKG